MIPQSIQKLWGNVVRSTAQSSPHLVFVVELNRETEVAYLQLHVLVDENVAELDVSMDDIMIT